METKELSELVGKEVMIDCRFVVTGVQLGQSGEILVQVKSPKVAYKHIDEYFWVLLDNVVES